MRHLRAAWWRLGSAGTLPDMELPTKTTTLMPPRPRRRRARAASLLVTLCGVAATIGASVPQTAGAAGLTAELRTLVREGVPGATVLIRDGGRTSVFSAGHASRGVAMRGQQRFKIGSITKPMVATVVLQLVDEGRLSLDQPISTVVGDLAGGDARITVRDLLAHKSGLFEFTNDPKTFAPYLAGDLGHVWTPRQLVGIGVSHRPAFAPGSRVAYSNTNYVLLGLIVEKVTGTSLETQLRQRVFEPLHLRHTSAPTRPGVLGVHGYLVGRGRELQDVTALSPSVYWAAGHVVSTTRDLADFLSALLGGKLLSPQMLAEMKTFGPMYPGVDYGLGLSREALPCGRAVGHDGAVAGYLTVALQMNDGRTVVAMANSITLEDQVGTKRAQAQWVRLVTQAACGGGRR